MAKVKVLAGDFLKKDGIWHKDEFRLYTKSGLQPDARPSGRSIRTVEIATEESVKRAGGTIGGAAVGAILLGPVGLVAGALLGGQGKDITIIVEFYNGRKLLATVGSDTYKEILAAKGL
jgi:uncharacterized protein YcfJ